MPRFQPVFGRDGIEASAARPVARRARQGRDAPVGVEEFQGRLRLGLGLDEELPSVGLAHQGHQTTRFEAGLQSPGLYGQTVPINI